MKEKNLGLETRTPQSSGTRWGQAAIPAALQTQYRMFLVLSKALVDQPKQIEANRKKLLRALALSLLKSTK